MLGVSLIIIAAAIVYMVETYISTYYTIEYMHGTSLFLVLLAEYGTPVLFLLLCAYIAYRNFLKKQKAAASAASERPTSKEELYTNKIQTAVKTKSVFSEQADQMLYQVRRFGQKMAVAYSMTQDSKTSGEQAKCLTLLESAERMGDESIGRAAIEKIELAWQADPSKFRVDKKQNRLIYSYPPDGPWYELKYIADELPNSLEAEISGGNQLIMNYEQAQELFGIKFRRWLGIFNL